MNQPHEREDRRLMDSDEQSPQSAHTRHGSQRTTKKLLMNQDRPSCCSPLSAGLVQEISFDNLGNPVHKDPSQRIANMMMRRRAAESNARSAVERNRHISPASPVNHRNQEDADLLASASPVGGQGSPTSPVDESLPERLPKERWAELVGQDGEAAATKLRLALGVASVGVIPDGAMVTMDFRPDRVRVFVDTNGNVARVPRRG